MKSWISLSILFQPLQNLPLHSRGSNFNLKDGISCSIYLSHSVELSDQLFHGYRLLACDGSNVNIARDPDDERTFIHEGEKGYNAIHINALYDIMNHTYCDFLVQGKRNFMNGLR